MSDRYDQYELDGIPSGFEKNVIVNPYTRRFLGLQLYDPLFVTSVVGEAFNNRLLMEQILLELQRMNTYLSLVVDEDISDEDIIKG